MSTDAIKNAADAIKNLGAAVGGAYNALKSIPHIGKITAATSLLAGAIYKLYKYKSTGEMETDGPVEMKYNLSLTAASKPALVAHNVIIEDRLANNDIMLALMSLLNQQVIAWILMALQLGEQVVGSKTVKDVLSTIATEAINNPYIDSIELVAADGVPVSEITDQITLENIHNYKVDSILDINMVGNESTTAQVVDMELKSTRLLSTRVIEVVLGRKNAVTTTTNQRQDGGSLSEGSRFTTSKEQSREKDVKGGKNNPNVGVYSKTIKEGVQKTDEANRTENHSDTRTSTTTTSTEGTIVVRIGVHLIPYFLTTTQLTTLLDISNPLGINLRWKKVLAGEIHWFKDFVLCSDLVDQYGKALKQDKHNQLAEILNTDTYKRMRTYANELKKQGANSQNTASTIIIVDAQTMKNISHSSDLDVNNFASREKFFKATMSLMLVVVDDMYNVVKIYYNALKMYTTCTFSMLNRVGQKSDSYDLKDILSAFGSNQNIRY